mmetsp:Transcript_28811/g.38427  ORF Transcript_28811/g.38427 Transcript_28811/m.38427 type:complete len:178 (+) Transcript_28811:606-1139(+)|eukprot:CAMPEP_0185604974 /NCGR_PEP_ID=MMETSP0436-20130131/3699_1 /TAXON_ID=626734 ORGANISM="Favella taraikaensis, Strain Fe Narragansett Bay" /NCGR_SAMPLE_ID=MMETSP0436 /ASSEMBLY_ACC=CAM_ASM_000390 /LENGTH=177 /DNA_ID=CAMNT_0028236009 /DNA_START=515 /DNA_END=1048 /DNA_ORIENTATION=+
MDFFVEHKIGKRQFAGYQQYNATDIINALQQYWTRDTFCVLGLTNEHLYPRKEWSFVEGLTDKPSRCGVASFARHGEWLGTRLSEEQKHVKWLKRCCATIVRQGCQMFGLKHCIYYECAMNASNSSRENDNIENRILCPICLCKLKTNLKFDCMERYAKLIDVSASLGFEAKTILYS